MTQLFCNVTITKLPLHNYHNFSNGGMDMLFLGELVIGILPGPLTDGHCYIYAVAGHFR